MDWKLNEKTCTAWNMIRQLSVSKIATFYVRCYLRGLQDDRIPHATQADTSAVNKNAHL